MSDPLAALAPHQQELVRTALAGDYYTWCGAELVSVGPGEACVRLRPPPEFVTPFGGINGGALSGLLELPSFVALASALEAGEFAVTNDLFVQHLRPVASDAEILLEGRLLRRGRRMAWTEASARADGKTTTLARITKTIVAEK